MGRSPIGDVTSNDIREPRVWLGARFAVFFQWRRQGEEQLASAIDAQQAIQVIILPHWPVFSQDSRAHKNTWIKTKVDLSSVPHFGVARDSVTRAVLFAGTARHVSGALKRFVRKGFGQGVGNEVLFFCFCPFGRVFVCVLLRCSKCAARGSV
jgi:hypothetical protein